MLWDNPPQSREDNVHLRSLIATRKLCLTTNQWRKQSEYGNATARKLVQGGTGTLNKFNN